MSETSSRTKESRLRGVIRLKRENRVHVWTFNPAVQAFQRVITFHMGAHVMDGPLTPRHLAGGHVLEKEPVGVYSVPVLIPLY